MEVNLEKGYFKGGSKTAAGKNRIVPIHSSIYPLVQKRMSRDERILIISDGSFRKTMYSFCEAHGFRYHTPHDCRHTFSALCERYEVKENDRKRMLGHAFSDITNAVYGHRELNDLKREIEKIKV